VAFRQRVGLRSQPAQFVVRTFAAHSRRPTAARKLTKRRLFARAAVAALGAIHARGRPRRPQFGLQCRQAACRRLRRCVKPFCSLCERRWIDAQRCIACSMMCSDRRRFTKSSAARANCLGARPILHAQRFFATGVSTSPSLLVAMHVPQACATANFIACRMHRFCAPSSGSGSGNARNPRALCAHLQMYPSGVPLRRRRRKLITR
jgi:hypothetical protein